jgi:hypothetical protein
MVATHLVTATFSASVYHHLCVPLHHDCEIQNTLLDSLVAPELISIQAQPESQIHTQYCARLAFNISSSNQHNPKPPKPKSLKQQPIQQNNHKNRMSILKERLSE